jgi:hypothetical protein
MNGQIFISYFRDDTYAAGRLYDRLSEYFPKKQIFRDVDALASCNDFAKAIETRIAESDALIAVIGANWLASKDERDGRRLDNPNDPVRLEIVTALRFGIRVIPVLVSDASIPMSRDLPEDLKPLAYLRYLRISDTLFDYDYTRLVIAIAQILEKNAPRRLAKRRLGFLELLRICVTWATEICVTWAAELILNVPKLNVPQLNIPKLYEILEEPVVFREDSPSRLDDVLVSGKYLEKG